MLTHVVCWLAENQEMTKNNGVSIAHSMSCQTTIICPLMKVVSIIINIITIIIIIIIILYPM